MRQYIIFTYCLLFAAPVFAQVPDAAVKEYNTALQYHLKKKDSLAYVAMHKAIQTYPGYAEAYSTLG
ncbi:MAG: hypothetical protein KDC07_01655, partial [Chitinophagaceae bacterium]|nr:hypothetical protein [Chitinophagaceae bacterium]